MREDTRKQLVEQDKRRVREKEKLQAEMMQKIELTKQDAYAHSQSMLHTTTRKVRGTKKIAESSRVADVCFVVLFSPCVSHPLPPSLSLAQLLLPRRCERTPK